MGMGVMAGGRDRHDVAYCGINNPEGTFPFLCFHYESPVVELTARLGLNAHGR